MRIVLCTSFAHMPGKTSLFSTNFTLWYYESSREQKGSYLIIVRMIWALQLVKLISK